MVAEMSREDLEQMGGVSRQIARERFATDRVVTAFVDGILETYRRFTTTP
jgi:hypothetical protein